MRATTIICVAIGIFFRTTACAQISFKTEYTGNSHYMHEHWQGRGGEEIKPEKVGKSRGSSLVYSGSVSIPFHMKMDGNNRPTAWGVSLSGSYASLDNRNFTTEMVSEIINLSLGFFHTRPLGDKVSITASLGAGFFTPHARSRQIGWEHVLGSGGVVLIWHLRRNLDLGGGLAVTNSLGYPMIFPAIYINWRLEGKFKFNVAMMEKVELSGGYEFTDRFRLSLAFEMNGQMALLKRDGKRMMFSHQYMTLGLKPEVKLGKSGLSLFAMGGLSAHRPAEYSELTLKSLFVGSNDSYYFRGAPYVSVGIGLGF